MKKALCLAAGLAFALSAQAAKTYTAGDLVKMVSEGSYPAMNPNSTVQTESMNYDACRITVSSIMGEMKKKYPVKTMFDTTDSLMVRAWMHDGVVTATCSKRDATIVLGKADYR